jgi:tripartite-type tricarboxylate transporter receptor subunit TctC
MKMFTVVFASLLAFLILSVATATSAEDFPKRNITLIVTFSPGGGFDSIARAIARSMKKFLPSGINVIVKNVTGAGGVRGAVALYRAKPDGYTIGHLQAYGLLGLQVLRGAKKIGFDIQKYSWVAHIGADPFGLLVGKNSPYRSVKDLAGAKRVTYGVEGIGVGRWFPSFISAQEMGIPFDVVSGYRGTGESLPALFRGDFNVWANPIDHPSVTPYLKTGELIPVVALSETRAKFAPDTPTAKELGYDLVYKEGRAIAAPPGLPADRAKILEDLLLKAMADQEYKQFLEKSGTPLIPEGPERTRTELKYYSAILGKYRPVILKSMGK